MKHIISFSGGLGSWATAKRVLHYFNAEDVILLFANTYDEDEDLYRFICETVSDIYDGKLQWNLNTLPPN